MCAALANVEEDNWEWHTFDTVKGGDYLVDQDAAEVMCREAIDAVLDLEKMGLPFNRTPRASIDQRRFGGHTRNHGEAAVRRSCFAADRTGHMILQTLYQQCIKQNIEFFNEFYVLDLVMIDGRAAGVVAYELATGELHVFQAKSVVFATGGFGKVFRTTSNAHTLTGDGMGIVWRKGLPLEDMEFFQFHPTGLAGLGVLLSEAARGEGGILRNNDGERFMERYAPTIKDLAPRDMVARAMANEVREGRGCGPDGDYVYLDLTHLEPAHIDAKLPDITEFARTYLGVEPVHRADAGLSRPRTTRWAASRPTSRREALSDNDDRRPGPVRRGRGGLRVGARREPAGHQLAARHQRVRPARRHRRRGVRRDGSTTSTCRTSPDARASSMVEALRDGDGQRAGRRDPRRAAGDDGPQRAGLPHRGVAQAGAGRHRAAEGRATRTSTVQDKGKRYNTDLLEAVELGFLLDLAEVLVVSALRPQRVRGGHFREDYPNRDDVNFMRHTMAYRDVSSDGRARRSASTTSRSSRPATSRWSGSTDGHRSGLRPVPAGLPPDDAGTQQHKWVSKRSTSRSRSAGTTPR